MQPQIRPLCEGVRSISLPDSRFKNTLITVALFLPLRAETVEEYALLPRLLTRSCASCPDFTALHRRLDRLYGAEITGDCARVGESQVLLFTADCTADRYALHGERLAADCADLLCDMLFDPLLENGMFRESDVLTERRCLAESVRAQVNEKGWYARRRAEQLLCENEAYGIGRYGSADRIESLTPEAMTAAWRRALRDATVQVVLQSDSPLPSVEHRLATAFSAVPERHPLPCETDTETTHPTLRRETERMEVNQCKLVLGFRAGCAEPDEGVAATRLMSALLGGTATSLLMRNVREKLSLCYYCSSQYDRLKGVLFVQSGVDEQNAVRTETEILNQIRLLCDGTFTDDELESARRAVLQSFGAVGDSQSAQAAWYGTQAVTATPKTPAATRDEIAAVTRDDVIAAAKRLSLECVFLLAPTEVSTHD